jgi:hypothetical protein
MIMSPDTPLFGRLTLGNNRISLGRAGMTTLMIRATEQLRKIRVSDSTVIQLEMSRDKLPDSTTFDRAALQEHQFVEQINNNPDAESPYPGITLGRVAEAMESLEYINYAMLCEPSRRLGFSNLTIDNWREAYESKFPDCAHYFPKWID